MKGFLAMGLNSSKMKWASSFALVTVLSLSSAVSAQDESSTFLIEHPELESATYQYTTSSVLEEVPEVTRALDQWLEEIAPRESDVTDPFFGVHPELLVSARLVDQAASDSWYNGSFMMDFDGDRNPTPIDVNLKRTRWAFDRLMSSHGALREEYYPEWAELRTIELFSEDGSPSGIEALFTGEISIHLSELWTEPRFKSDEEFEALREEFASAAFLLEQCLEVKKAIEEMVLAFGFFVWGLDQEFGFLPGQDRLPLYEDDMENLFPVSVATRFMERLAPSLGASPESYWNLLASGVVRQEILMEEDWITEYSLTELEAAYSHLLSLDRKWSQWKGRLREWVPQVPVYLVSSRPLSGDLSALIRASNARVWHRANDRILINPKGYDLALEPRGYSLQRSVQALEHAVQVMEKVQESHSFYPGEELVIHSWLSIPKELSDDMIEAFVDSTRRAGIQYGSEVFPAEFGYRNLEYQAEYAVPEAGNWVNEWRNRVQAHRDQEITRIEALPEHQAAVKEREGVLDEARDWIRSQGLPLDEEHGVESYVYYSSFREDLNLTLEQVKKLDSLSKKLSGPDSKISKLRRTEKTREIDDLLVDGEPRERDQRAQAVRDYVVRRMSESGFVEPRSLMDAGLGVFAEYDLNGDGDVDREDLEVLEAVGPLLVVQDY